ncbi:hypothetical protein JB92DRAFT_3100157 [Gautieria morchelliformis]|nr:hypothetical protein JB92DRAFT_3100157 [Gautieria morchelliformis]
MGKGTSLQTLDTSMIDSGLWNVIQSSICLLQLTITVSLYSNLSASALRSCFMLTTYITPREQYVRQYDLNMDSDVGVFSVRKLGYQYIQPQMLSFNTAEHTCIPPPLALSLKVEMSLTWACPKSLRFGEQLRPLSELTHCSSCHKFSQYRYHADIISQQQA